ncbi:MAG: hypothetical protein WAR79_01555 [Melioribacteraceae bacterium]
MDKESSRFWGMVNNNGTWIGENILGKLWMDIRATLQVQTKSSQP